MPIRLIRRQSYGLPAIYDITTDPIDPPKFEAIARSQAAQHQPGRLCRPLYRQQQRVAYSDIEPDLTTASPQEASNAVLKVIAKRKWHVVDARPPQAIAPRDGLIEAIARTPILGFRDDVAVRVRATQEGSRIDVRSASRYGRHDLGTNAARVRSLIDEVDEVLTTPAKPRSRTSNRSSRRRSPVRRRARAIRSSDSAVDRRHAVGVDDAAGDQIFEVRQDRQTGRAGQARIDVDIDRPHQVGCRHGPCRGAARSTPRAPAGDGYSSGRNAARRAPARHGRAGRRLTSARQLFQ